MSSPPSEPARPPPQPLLNPKYRHISRSAAKRESVQLLGSIKDLQRHFLRAASIEHRPGAGIGVKGLGTLGEEEENRDPADSLSASTNGGPSRDRKLWKEVELQRVDIETARKEVKAIISDLRGLWSLGGGTPGTSASTSPTTPTFGQTDTQQLLVRTARSIRRVRELSLSITQTGRKVSNGMSTLPRPKQGRTSISTPSRPAATLPRAVSASGSTLPVRQSSLGAIAAANDPSDTFGSLRRAAMEVLAGLRGMEERLRLQSNTAPVLETGSGLSGTQSVSASSTDDPSRPPSSMSGLVSEPESMNEQEEEEWNMNILAADGDLHRHIETWEERIAAEGREYRAISSGEAGKEREAVRRWLGVVESVFRSDGEREATGRWADGDWEGSQSERIHDFLLAHLALDLQLYLPNVQHPDLRQVLLSRLSDGYILIQAFNNALGSSSRSWGFVPDDDIHDTLNAVPTTRGDGSATSEAVADEKSNEGWTFRRIGNLTAWAAALRQRYNILLTLPSRTTSSAFLIPPTPRPTGPASSPDPKLRRSSPDGTGAPGRKSDVPAYLFDPAKVAKREPGWEEMLEGLVVRWIEEVATEVKGGGVVRDRTRGGMI